MDINQRVKGGTVLLGLLGNPVAHSISPQLHNTISDILGKDTVYVALRVQGDKLGEAVGGIKACGFLGFNITVPHKEAVIKFCDELSDDVILMGAANTVKITDDRLYAYNTDGSGFIRALKLQTGQDVKGKKIVILGAGGTARSISVKLAQEGAKSICIVNRTVEKARCIEEIINTRIHNIACSMGYEEAYSSKAIEQCDIIVNTTSLGLHPNIEGCPLDENLQLKKNQLVYDVIYKPEKTRLLRIAESFGCITANGLGMLICQGIEAYEIWMDMKIPQKALEQVFQVFIKYSRG